MPRGILRARPEQPTILFRLIFASAFLVFSTEKLAYQSAPTPALAMRGDRLATPVKAAIPRDVKIVTPTDPIQTASVPSRIIQAVNRINKGDSLLARRPEMINAG